MTYELLRAGHPAAQQRYKTYAHATDSRGQHYHPRRM